MIKALKTFFLTRLFREKLLLLIFVLCGTLIWLSSFTNRAGAFWRQQRMLNTQLANQTQWLNQSAQIAESAKQTLAKLDPTKTLNDSALFSQVTAMAAEAGMRNNVQISAAPPERTSQFTVNSLTLTVNKTDMRSLVNLYEALQKRSPYIGLDEMGINVDTGNSSLLGARFHISSFQVAP